MPRFDVQERRVEIVARGKPSMIRATATQMDDGRWDPGCVVDVGIDEAASEMRHLSFGDYPFYATSAEALDAGEAAGRAWADGAHA